MRTLRKETQTHITALKYAHRKSVVRSCGRTASLTGCFAHAGGTSLSSSRHTPGLAAENAAWYRRICMFYCSAAPSTTSRCRPCGEKVHLNFTARATRGVHSFKVLIAHHPPLHAAHGICYVLYSRWSSGSVRRSRPASTAVSLPPPVSRSERRLLMQPTVLLWLSVAAAARLATSNI